MSNEPVDGMPLFDALRFITHSLWLPIDDIPIFGAPGRIRTCYPRLRRPMLYPYELQALRTLDFD
tara:strand:+ start:45 stop:239 length:195 start_codon:yes stop_codon:yes gene_type:complete